MNINGKQEAIKPTQIPSTNTIVYPGTVVIKFGDTPITALAMPRSGWAVDNTITAYTRRIMFF